VRAAFWFGPPNVGVFGLVALALAAGYLKGRFIFSRLALRNIRRIRELSPHKEKICVFAFQAIHSYVIVAAMMTLGILLRHSPIPREILAVIYLAIGAALIYGSLPYWRAGRGNR
jgi:hypothetical protein